MKRGQRPDWDRRRGGSPAGASSRCPWPDSTDWPRWCAISLLDGVPTASQYAGHVTLARVRGRTAGPAALAGVPVEGRFAVTGVTLFASSPGPDGVTYEVLADVPVAGGGPG